MLQHASDELRSDREIALEAAKQRPALELRTGDDSSAKAEQISAHSLAVQLLGGKYNECAANVTLRQISSNDDGEALDSGRNPADMAKSFTRYSLLFQQSLNITVPCNIGLRIGGLINVKVPDVGPTNATREPTGIDKLMSFKTQRSDSGYLYEALFREIVLTGNKPFRDWFNSTFLEVRS